MNVYASLALAVSLTTSACMAQVQPDPPFVFCFRGDVGVNEPDASHLPWSDTRVVLRVEPPRGTGKYKQVERLPGMGLGDRDTRNVHGYILSQKVETPVSGTAFTTTSKFSGLEVWQISVNGMSVQPNYLLQSHGQDVRFDHNLVLELPADETSLYPEFNVPRDGWLAWTWNQHGPVLDADLNDKLGRMQHEDWNPVAGPFWRVPCYAEEHALDAED